ncbi:hypothetical protein BDV30DRAFT_201466 [Aspergillus minisclerotigenes]|uniref:Ketoreductase (KR) domain-containing protein n=1 Tax=Aspergillus minisclerotigenes TaxID=656917 RepID=A0A5N6JKC4_9EURO|nr:hypothetical protein BDV30DRAFT_201466 [Aspergillus minisclerotigenes]
MLSSISGIGGKKGQSNYSAANTFLDASAAYRQSLGLRANSVNLGPIEDVGYVAEQGGMHSHFDERVWTPLYEGNLRQISPINPSSSAQLVTGLGFPLPDNSDLIREARYGFFGRTTAGMSVVRKVARETEAVHAFLMKHKSGFARSSERNSQPWILPTQVH